MDGAWSASVLYDDALRATAARGGKVGGMLLEGITVVALEQAVAAPLATRQLADLGARVIKVERPGSGDFARAYDTTVRGLSSHFVWLNRSKESLTLDLKQSEGAAILARLLTGADVCIQNLAPGAAERLGFGGEALRARHPRLVVCELSGYGVEGPYRDKKAYDLLVQCETGVPSLTGTPETPSKAGIPVADIAGGMAAYSGVLAALYARERTGQGALLRTSLFDALVDWLGYPMYYTAYGGKAPARSGASHAAIAPYGPAPCADGVVFLAVQHEREWTALCERVLTRPELATDARFASNSARVTHRAELDAAIAAVTAAMPADELAARLEAAGIANARLRTVDKLIDHPQLAMRGRWGEVASPAGPLRALAPAVTFDNHAPRFDPIPDVGQHSESILRELGYDDARIAQLRADGVV